MEPPVGANSKALSLKAISFAAWVTVSVFVRPAVVTVRVAERLVPVFVL